MYRDYIGEYRNTIELFNNDIAIDSNIKRITVINCYCTNAFVDPDKKKCWNFKHF